MKQLRKSKMTVPKGYTEEQVLEIIKKVTNKLAPFFTFADFDVDDIRQEGTIIGMEVLEKDYYDCTRPLENFLYSHIRNRLINLKRNKFARHEPPCTSCPFYDLHNIKSSNQCTAFPDKMECSKYAIFVKNNNSKKNIRQPMDIDSVDFDGEKGMYSNIDVSEELQDTELYEKINEELPLELRGDFLRLMSGTSIPKSRRQKVQAAIQEILDGEE